MNSSVFSRKDQADPRLGILILLYKLNVVTLEKVSYSMASAIQRTFSPPPCSIQLAVVATQLEFLVFKPVKGRWQ